MQILGIDYGKKKSGLAVGDTHSKLSVPYKVLNHSNIEEFVDMLATVIKDEKVEAVVIGLSEGEMGEESRALAQKISQKYGIAAYLEDETLSTQDAQFLSRSAGIGRKKRQSLEDAYAAALVLQSWLDEQ